MNIIIDTNRYVDFCRGDAHSVEVVRQAELIYLSFVTMGELRAGFLCGNRSLENERTLVRFLNSSRVDVLMPDDQTTHHYAQLFRQLRQQGTPIPTNDLWIAALAVQHQMILFARDQHFDHLPQIPKI